MNIPAAKAARACGIKKWDAVQKSFTLRNGADQVLQRGTEEESRKAEKATRVRLGAQKL